MKKIGFILLSTATLLVLGTVCDAQTATTLPAKEDGSKQVAAKATQLTAKDAAKQAFEAHGGEKLKKLRSLSLRGTCDITSFGQAIPATFVMIIKGDKYYFEINNPFQPLKQIFDGKQTYSSQQTQGFSLPPITSLGFPLLPHTFDTGYVIAEVGSTKKKASGFRVTTPDGFYTDFFIDGKNGQVKDYESSYDINGRTVTTSVTVDEWANADGVLVPKKFSQRFDLGQITAYASFKAKEIVANGDVSDDTFEIDK